MSRPRMTKAEAAELLSAVCSEMHLATWEAGGDDRLTKAIARAVKAAGITKWFTPHGCRRTLEHDRDAGRPG